MRDAGNRLGCGEFLTEQPVYADITDEVIDCTVASVREFVTGPAAGQAQGFLSSPRPHDKRHRDVRTAFTVARTVA